MRALVSSLLVVVLAGCGVLRPEAFGEPPCPPYKEVEKVVVSRCAQCHSATLREGNYSVQDYASTVSRADNGVARVVPGEPSSLFLQATRGELGGHKTIDDDGLAALQEWVVRCRAAPGRHRYHPKGWTTPTDVEQFHGRELRRRAYDLKECRTCHGDDLRGGKAQVDCNGCHADGPLACNTCHGDRASFAPPRSLSGVRQTSNVSVGAHRAHVDDGPLHRKVACTSCHADVKNAEDEGHFLRGGAFDDGPAEVVLTSGPPGTAAWNRETATCANVYCHAPTRDDVAANRLQLKWTAQGTRLKCDNCHGAGPTGHFYDRCEVCHGASYADGGVDLTTHVNGKVDVKGDLTSCDACHAGSASPTFFDVLGQTSTAQVTVGAHQAHLRANRFRGPLACSDCHLVPASVTSAGHLDSLAPAEVFVASTDAGLAFTDGATPTWNRAAGTCSDVYCHGAGANMAMDTATYLRRTPAWTLGPTQAGCSYCHGLPPLDGTVAHTGATLLTCYTCHGQTINAAANIVFGQLSDGGVTTTHLDGRVTGN